ncbi:DEAD/DEAH box helicase [Flavobacterium terrigena]|uniref:DEAD/DEAH box helicase n=1 Tax=Flavobacterium terrigena TaxID=402734 RepID=A0A1H6S3Q4_9FLAO|nr:DEAD/DEAH box helicase [Flavobacterium terrigena]SEI62673.1 DEAD/DEAH box helicase [Flavobacterium terrigena]
MLTEEKRVLTEIIKKNSAFKDVITKLTIDEDLNENEKTYVLSCALMFLKEYANDKKYKSYAEISYFLILKYSIKYSDYKPLYDFSTIFGFYPISNTILENNLLSNNSLDNFFTTIQLQKFQKEIDINKFYIETYEQHKERNSFLNDDSNEKGFLAPTSYGKSSVIIDYIEKLQNNSKIVIIVPTKSLLMQTYKMIRDADLDYKILIHEEMYSNETKFIAVFTQERALRLLKRKKDIFFDVLIIDEAHNILKKVKSGDNRSLLLTRLLRLNKNLNENQKVAYLSPLINEIKNIKIEDNQIIHSHTIEFNIKAPEIYEYKIDNTVVKHNKYFINKLNTGFEIGSYKNFIEYLITNSGKKNFLYYNSPKVIEKLAIELAKNIEKSTDLNDKIIETINNLKEEVHDSFYGVDLLKHGIIYLHGKLPDLIKEYLETKFKELPELNYIIANSVILEGINLPIDTLFILNTYGLHGKELTNLIGRVNRLNDIFKNGNNLNKLLPKVHFINNEFDDKSNTNMFTKIQELRSRVFDDKIENPTLENYDIKKEKADPKVIAKLVNDEEFLVTTPVDELQKLKQYLIENGINLFYSDTDKLAKLLSKKLNSNKFKSSDWNDVKLLDKIYKVFIEDFTKEEKFLVDFEFGRLEQQIARDFYEKYIENRKYSLRENVNHLFKYLKGRKESTDKKHHIYYIGTTYGEIPYKSDKYFKDIHNKNVAIDLTKLTDKQLINYAIVKLKIEDDFISFKLNKFIVFLYDYNLISEDIYHQYVYGTNDKKIISFTKFGLNISLINRIKAKNQLQNLSFDANNNLKANASFKTYLKTLNDFKRFEIERFIS